MLSFSSQRVLYEALLRRDNTAFAYLYRLLYKRLATYVRMGGGTTDQTQELVHETIIAFLYRLRNEQYQWQDRTELTTYLLAIAHNIWRQKQRQQQQIQTLLPDDNLPDAGSDTDEFSFETRRLAVEKALAQLGEKCRQAIELYYWQGLSMTEIAQTLGWANEGVARKQKSLCLKELRRRLIPTNL